MAEPLAYFLTWTCYATWLHGDERGSTDAEGKAVAANRALRASDAAHSRTAPVELDPAARRIIERTIEDHCAIREWPLLALNARTNHVHVVVQCPGVKPEVAMTQFKAWATRRLREAGMLAHKTWTRHGSTVYLWSLAAVDEKVHYVENCQ